MKAGEKLVGINSQNINLELQSVRHLIDMAYTTKSSLIDCYYSLEIRADLEGVCLCRGDKYSFDTPISIYSTEAIEPRDIEAPVDWSPISYEQINIEYNSAFDTNV